jgi:transcriptional regulator
VVRRLTDKHEAKQPAVDGGRHATRFLAGQLRAIMGIDIMIRRVEAKAKLSQNRPTADIDGVIGGLRPEVTAPRPPPWCGTSAQIFGSGV